MYNDLDSKDVIWTESFAIDANLALVRCIKFLFRVDNSVIS